MNESQTMYSEWDRAIDTFLENALHVLFGRVLHAISNYLSGMYGMAQLTRVTQKSDHYHKTVEMAYTGCKNSKELIEAMATFLRTLGQAETGASVYESFNIVQLVMKHDLEKYSIQCDSNLSDSLMVVIPKRDMVRIIYLILSDCMSGMPDGGKISVSNDIHEDEAIIRISDSSGRKLSAELNNAIADSFVSAEDYEKFRLGIVRELVTRNGGTMSIQTTEKYPIIEMIFPLDT